MLFRRNCHHLCILRKSLALSFDSFAKWDRIKEISVDVREATRAAKGEATRLWGGGGGWDAIAIRPNVAC